MPPSLPTAPRLSRRTVVCTLGVTAGLMMAPPPLVAGWPLVEAPTEDRMAFDLLRQGSVIGGHQLRFRSADGRLHVENSIDARVAVLGIVLFRYRHRSLETYADGRLVAFESETDDDGGLFFVKATSTPHGLEVHNRNGVAIVPAGTMVASYWTRATLAHDRLLDPQRGRIRDQVVSVGEPLRMRVGDENRPAVRYAISGVVNGTVTYDDRGHWLAATIRKKGADIEYRRRA